MRYLVIASPAAGNTDGSSLDEALTELRRDGEAEVVAGAAMNAGSDGRRRQAVTGFEELLEIGPGGLLLAPAHADDERAQ